MNHCGIYLIQFRSGTGDKLSPASTIAPLHKSYSAYFQLKKLSALLTSAYVRMPTTISYMDSCDKVHAYTLRSLWMPQPETQSTAEIGTLIYCPYLRYKSHITVTLYNLWLQSDLPYKCTNYFKGKRLGCHNPLTKVWHAFIEVWIDKESISTSYRPMSCWTRDIPVKPDQYYDRWRSRSLHRQLIGDHAIHNGG